MTLLPTCSPYYLLNINDIIIAGLWRHTKNVCNMYANIWYNVTFESQKLGGFSPRGPPLIYLHPCYLLLYAPRAHSLTHTDSHACTHSHTQPHTHATTHTHTYTHTHTRATTHTHIHAHTQTHTAHTHAHTHIHMHSSHTHTLHKHMHTHAQLTHTLHTTCTLHTHCTRTLPPPPHTHPVK